MIGKTLGRRYRIDALIGSGGMAVVYRATDLRTKRTVAVKLLKEQFVQKSEFLSRFDREAMASAKMRHPNIVSLLDTGDQDGQRYLVIEYVQGMTLKELIRERGRLPYDEAIKVTLYILSALEHAHEKNIIHRDIKPQNILVDDFGHIKIADFGIAKMVDTATLTLAENNMMGSVHYFSPEQAKGRPTGVASDLYSTGVVLYEMLTGRVPFDGDTPYAVARQHIEGQHKPASTYAPELPIALEEILTKALCKDLSQRYESAAQMSADLRRARKHPEGGFVIMRPSQQTNPAMAEPPPPPPKRRRRWRKASIAVTLILGLGILTFLGITGYRLIDDVLSHTQVPDLLNLEENAALRLLERNDLSATVLRARSEVAQGLVFEQSPPSGERVVRGESVMIYISQGTGELTVPDVRGYTQEQAVDAIHAAGLEVGDQLKGMSDRPVDLVYDQLPEPGTVVQDGTVVDIYVSGGLVVVPDLKGLTENQAVEQLQMLDLQPGKISTMAEDDAEKDGLVQSQYPMPGESLFPQDQVDLSIARADRRPYKAEITVSVSIPKNGAHVRVTLVEPDGEESDQYAAMYALEGENEIKVLLRSNQVGEMMYRLYVDNLLQSETKVTLR